MTGCSADYCTNSSKKRFRMYKFPKEVKRRKIWVENVNRIDWVPGPSAMLCEVHFSDEMWEKALEPNGKRRLKATAVPTIFSDCICPLDKRAVDFSLDAQHTISCEQVPEHLLSVADKEMTTLSQSVEAQESGQFGPNERSKLEECLQKLKKLFKKAEKDKIKLKKDLKTAREQIKKLNSD
nr:PREDICTED: THAP domain-containing protein 2-like [Linepithema humile]